VTTSHAGEVFRGVAARADATVEAMLAERARARTGTLLKRLPTLDEVAKLRGLRGLGSRQRGDRRHRQLDVRLDRRLVPRNSAIDRTWFRRGGRYRRPLAGVA
jgi:hypothetical protein